MLNLELIFTGLVTLVSTLGGGYAWYAKQQSERAKAEREGRKEAAAQGEAAREKLYQNLQGELERLRKQIQDLEAKVETLVAKVDHRDALIDRWQAGFYTVKRLVHSHGSPELVDMVEECTRKVLAETHGPR